MRGLIALQDKATVHMAQRPAAATIDPAGRGAARHRRVVVSPVRCRRRKPEMIRTSFSRRWTGLDFRLAAMGAEMDVAAVVAEPAAIGALAACRAKGSRNPAAMLRDSRHPDAAMTGLIEMTEATGRLAERVPISRIP
jgi:hypothetical protein